MSPNFTTAKDYRMYMQATVDPSRCFFEELTSDARFGAGDYAAPTDTPVGQVSFWDSYNARMVTLVVSAGTLYGMVQGDTTKHGIAFTIPSEQKPGARDLQDGTAEVWYLTTGGQIAKIILNTSVFVVMDSQQIPFSHNRWSLTRPAFYPQPDGECLMMYVTSLGGVSCSMWMGYWINWEGRFMCPYATSQTGYWVIYTAALSFNSIQYFYWTDLKRGTVYGVKLVNYIMQEWTDTYVVLPADLSRFCVTNAVELNGFIHLAGQFHRTKDLADAEVYSLVLRSRDGKNFSWDRFSLLSTLGYQFQIAVDTMNGILYASDRNAIGRASCSYFFYDPPPGRLEIRSDGQVNHILSFNDSGESAQLRIVAGEEIYLRHPTLAKYNRLTLAAGFAANDMSLYNTYIIDSISQDFADGVRSLILNLVPEGIWKTDQIAFPFYSELNSKIAMIDDCDKRDNLYPAAGGQMGDYVLVVDFWNNSEWEGGSPAGNGIAFRTPTGSGCERNEENAELVGVYRKGFRSPDLNETNDLADYPKLENPAPWASFYGWCRTSDVNRPNDRIVAYLITANADGELTTHAGAAGYLGIDQFQQEYPDLEGAQGCIYFEWSGLTVGDEVRFVAIQIYNETAVGYTVFSPERLELHGVSFNYTTLNPAIPWEQTKPSSYPADHASILEVPRSGMPFILFATKPYSAFNVRCMAEFVYDGGSYPLSAGTTAWGIVLIAEDAANYIVGRFNRQRTSLEIVKVEYGLEVRLAEFGVKETPYNIYFEHRDGRLQLGVNSSPYLDFFWNEGYGPMSTSELEIMHCGVYGAKIAPGFRTPSFCTADAKGIPMLPSESMLTILETFPESGQVVCDDEIYSYNGKTGVYMDHCFGPYQGRCTGDFGSYSENGVSFTGMGIEISLYHPRFANNYCFGYLFATDNGHTWVISNIDWTVEPRNGFSLRNRCRIYGQNVYGNFAGIDNKTYITAGLLAPTKVEGGDPVLHPWGSWVFLYGTDRIWLDHFSAATVDTDATVKDMITSICGAASVQVEFPGDFHQNVMFSNTAVRLASDRELLSYGFDFSADLCPYQDGIVFYFYSDNLAVADSYLMIEIHNDGNNMLALHVGTWADRVKYLNRIVPQAGNFGHNWRFLAHGDFISIYIDGIWLETISFLPGVMVWPKTDLHLFLQANANTHYAYNCRLVELFDWRESIYMESEMSAQSALGSVIQERPVEIYPTRYGGLSFSFRTLRQEWTLNNSYNYACLRHHTDTDSTGKDSGSDAVVYYREVAFVNDERFARTDGFLTRVLKMATLDYGAENAARMLLRRANERQHQHNVEMRPDLRFNPGDRLHFAYRVSGTDTQICFTMIVESKTMEIREGMARMTLAGRHDSLKGVWQDTAHAYLGGV